MTLDDIVQAVKAAHDSHTPLRIRGAGSKDFYGGMLSGEVLEVAGYRGIVAYEPTELYITAQCGTPLAEIEAALAEKGQMLACEPPRFSGATVGGCVAAGLSGPRRQQAGAVRDFVLGVKLIDGTGQVLNFGGQVMKNVAGYDVSRLLAGSLGTLGVLAEVTLKVLPMPVAERTLVFALEAGDAVTRLNQWGGQPLPISASSGMTASCACACPERGRRSRQLSPSWVARSSPRPTACGNRYANRRIRPSPAASCGGWPCLRRLVSRGWMGCAPSNGGVPCAGMPANRKRCAAPLPVLAAMPCSTGHRNPCAAEKVPSHRCRRPCSPCIDA